MNSKSSEVYDMIMLLVILLAAGTAFGQDTTIQRPVVKGGLYDRPYLFKPASRIAIGGYAEMLARLPYEEGIGEGLSFEARRFNIFLFSSITNGIKLTSELEFEHGTEEIKLETALIDIELFEPLTLRGGILLSPIGKFNLAHDSPINRFNDRPLVSTRIIPSTLSEAGLGVHGSFYVSSLNRLVYEVYLVNGLNDGVLLAGDGTSLPAGRPESFEEDNNGRPSIAARIAIQPEFGGDFGVSVHTGPYNTFKREGLDVDERRRLTILALDGEIELGDVRVQSEFARARIELPTSLRGLFAEQQIGVYGQATVTPFHNVLPMFPRSELGFGARYDYVDLDSDVPGSDTHRLTLGLTLYFAPETVLKLDYQHNWNFDRVNNLTRAAAIQLGLATYF